MCTLYMEVVNSSQSVGFTKCRIIPSIYWMTHVGEKMTVYTQQKSSAQVGVRVNSVLTRKGCIKYYTSLFTEIIL